MTDIGLPLARPPWRDLAGIGRDAVRLIAPPVVLAVLLVGGWEALSRSGMLSARLLPAPSKVFDTLVRSLGVLLEQAQPTFWGALAGIVLAAALGIALGAAVSYSRTLMQAVYPTIVFFQLIPKVALAPVFLLWFGTGFGANVIFSVFIAFFPVVVATITGLQAAPPSYERLCRSLMMSRRGNRAVRLLPRAGGSRHAALRQPLRAKRHSSVLVEGQTGDLRDQLLGQGPAECLMSFGNDSK